MTTYEEILDEIAQHQDECFTCYNYRHKSCGFVYPDKRLPQDACPSQDDVESLSGDDYWCMMTQVTGERCTKHPDEIIFLEMIEKGLRNIPSGVDEDTVNYVLQRSYRILNKYPSDCPLYRNTPIRDEVQKAITLMLAYIDFDSIQNGASIYRLIQSVDVGYDRKSGLFKICPQLMAASLLEHCVVQDHSGYYDSTGNFDARIWDIEKTTYIGESWLDVIAYQEQKKSTNFEPHADRSKPTSEPESPPANIPSELRQLIDAGLLTNGLQLKPKQSRKSVVEYCHDHDLFKPWGLNEWRKIDCMISDRSGKEITAESLKQAYQDYQKLYL